MLKEETLSQVEGTNRCYKEPEGEIIEVLSENSRTISVLTRIEPEKVGGVGAPFDPEEFTVQALKADIDGSSYSDKQLEALLEAEQDGKDRTTAISAIQERLQ